MGLFEKWFPKKHEQLQPTGYFRLLNGYSPVFTTWDGQLYESELVRSAIDARSRHISKLEIRIDGAAKPKLQTKLAKKPNDLQTWPQFLYRLNTILDMKNTAFIMPVYDRYMEQVGITSVYTARWELIQTRDGTPWLRLYFDDGRVMAEELSNVGIMTKFQYKSDLFGETNIALDDTMQLIDVQKQGIEEAVKSSASFRFMAQSNNFVAPEDMKKERERFASYAIKGNDSQFLLFPNTYTNIQQIQSKPFTVDAEQQKLIQTNVFNYYGVNEKVLQNSALGDDLDAFFNGAIEPFSIQLSEVMTSMLFTQMEQAHGSAVYATANRLQYMPVAQKIAMAQQLGDRGMILIDEARALFNYPPLPDGNGQHAPIRGEFYMVGDDRGDENGEQSE